MEQVNGKLIFQQIPKIMADVDPISKNRQNVQQSYKFRGIDDVYQALQAVLAKHSVFSTSEILSERTEDRQTSKGSNLIYRILKVRWTLWASDGSSVQTETIGEGMDSGDKASNKAMSVAHKYALLQVFAIPTEDAKDPEVDHHQARARGSVVAPDKVNPQAIIESFAKIGWARTDIEKAIGCPVEQITLDQKAQLLKVFQDVKATMANQPATVQ